MTKLIKIIATVFGIGYLPITQGTVASLAGLGIYFLISRYTSIYVALSIVVITVGFIVSGIAERLYGQKDSHKIVIDDLSGMLAAYLFIPYRLPYIIAGFFIYRFLDIIKLYPLKRLEGLPAGWGIMLDDLAAALYTNIILQVITRIFIC